MYIIHKSSRIPDFENGSYSGPTWDAAKIRRFYKKFYISEDYAKDIAAKLSEHNRCGFNVSKVPNM